MTASAGSAPAGITDWAAVVNAREHRREREELLAVVADLGRQVGLWEDRLARLGGRSAGAPDAADRAAAAPDRRPLARGRQEIRACLRDLVGDAQHCVAWFCDADDALHWSRLARAIPAGRSVRARALLGCAGPTRQAVLGVWAEEAAAVRVSRVAGPAPGQLIVDDLRAYLLSDTDGAAPQLHEVADPLVVAALGASFDRAWHGGLALGEARALLAVLDSDVRRSIVGLLADGAKDEAISRSLGLSLRTCRRHIAEIMSAITANSRFQAGVALAPLAPECAVPAR